MKRELKPVRNPGGSISVPGDKSISHRAVLLSLLSKGPISIINFAGNADCYTSLEAVKQFGVTSETSGDKLILTPPENISIDENTLIDCGNSGTTARLLGGLLAGLKHRVILTGDASLSRRPMKRIIDPLTKMGAELLSDEGTLPLTVVGKKLLPFEQTMQIPSAQVKSAIILAGIAAGCTTIIREEQLTRDHTELMVQAIGEGLTVKHIKPVVVEDEHDPRKKRLVMPESFKKEITVAPTARINGGEIDVPGDISTAAFFFAAAAISKQTITVTNVGLNPTRTGFLTHLKKIGCKVTITNKQVISGELRGTVTVTGETLKARKISGEAVVNMIDELPLVAVMGAFADGTTIIRDAAELRVKESDRLSATAENLNLMGVNCGLLEDGLAIEGRPEPEGADFVSHGDHRIAMAFSIASLFLDGPSTIDDDTVVEISCPEFYEILESISS